jgi:Glycosyltransferase family 87
MPATSHMKFVLASFLLGTASLHAVLFWMARRQVKEGYPDFTIFYAAGLMVRRGQAAHLYDNQLQGQTEREFAQVARTKEGQLPYNHPPFEVLPFLPLTFVSYLPAYGLWLLVNLLLLAAMLRALGPQLPVLFSIPGLPYFAALGFFPVAVALMQGQDSILLLSLYVLVFLALESGKDFRGGMLLGLGLFKFQLVLPFAFVLLIARRWRAVGGMLATGIGVGALSLALVGWNELLYYPHYVWQVNEQAVKRVIAPGNMPNLRGLMTGWNGGTRAPMWVNAMILGVSVLALTWAAGRWNASRPEHRQSWRSGFSLGMVVTFLVSYHGYAQDMSILLLPLLLLFDQLLSGRVLDGRWRRALEICLLLMFFSPIYMVLALHYQHLNLLALVLVALAGSLAGWTKASERLDSLAAAL